MTGDGFTWEAMYADIRAADRGSNWQRDLIQAAHRLAKGDETDMGWFTAKYSGDDDGGTLGWGSLADAGRVPSLRGRKHDANVIKTSKTRLKAEAKHITKAEAKARAAKAAPKGKGGKGK